MFAVLQSIYQINKSKLHSPNKINASNASNTENIKIHKKNNKLELYFHIPTKCNSIKNTVSKQTALYIKESIKKSIDKITKINIVKSPFLYNIDSQLNLDTEMIEYGEINKPITLTMNFHWYILNNLFFFALGGALYGGWNTK